MFGALIWTKRSWSSEEKKIQIRWFYGRRALVDEHIAFCGATKNIENMEKLEFGDDDGDEVDESGMQIYFNFVQWILHRSYSHLR